MRKITLSKEEKRQIKFRLELVDNAQSGSKSEFHDTAERMIQLYKGQHFLGTPTRNEDRLIINYAQVNADILTTSLSYTDPALTIRPMSEKARASAELQKAILSKTWVETNTLVATQQAMQDSAITGLGGVFVGWRYETIDGAPIEGNRPDDAYDYAENNQPLDVPDEQLGNAAAPVPGMPPEGAGDMSGLQQQPNPALQTGSLPPEGAGGEGGAGAQTLGELLQSQGVPIPLPGQGAAQAGAGGLPGGEMPPQPTPPMPELGGGLPGGSMSESPEAPDTLVAEHVVYDNPIVRRVDPLTVYVDPDHFDLENLADAKYLVEVKEITLDDLRKDPRFKGKTKKIQGTSRLDRRYLTPGNMESDDVKRVVLYDYWQKDKRIHVIICDEQLEEPLFVEEWPYRFPTYPYIFMVFRRVPNQQAPQGQIEPAEACIQELDKYRTIQINHDKRYAKGRTAFDVSRLTPGGMKALQDGQDGALIEVQGNPNEVFGNVPDDALPPDFYATGMAVKQDISVLMGVDDWSRGAPDRTRRTKGEVDTLTAKSATRGQFIQVKYERFCSKIAKLMLLLLQDDTFCDNPRWIELEDKDNQQDPQQFYWNYQDVLGQSEVEVVCNSTRVQTPESQQQTWVNLLQMCAPFVQAGAIDIGPVMEEVLKAFDVPESIRKKIEQQGGGAMMQMQQAIQQMMQQGQQMGQALQQIMQQGQQMEQQVQQLAEKVTELDGRLDMSSADLKTQMQIKKMQADIEMDREKHQMDMHVQQQNIQQADQVHQQQLGAKALGAVVDLGGKTLSTAQSLTHNEAAHQQQISQGAMTTGQTLRHGEEAHQAGLKNKETLTKAQAQAKGKTNGSKNKGKKA